MTPIKCFSEMTIDLGSTAYLHIAEDSDGDWNVKIGNPHHIRIGVEGPTGGIHFRYVKDLINCIEGLGK